MPPLFRSSIPHERRRGLLSRVRADLLSLMTLLKLMLIGVFLVGLPTPAVKAQQYGLDAAVAIGPFLDGTLPTRTPNAPGSSNWDLVDAFPNLVIDNTLVIVPNPADDRLYVGSRTGIVSSFQNDATTTTTEPFMDLTDRVAVVWDGGFLGMAFHPDFGTPGAPNETTFFAYYNSYCPTTADKQDIDFAACNPSYSTQADIGFFDTWLRLSRFQAFYDATAGVWRGDPASEEPLINLRMYNSSHYGGGPTFANDGTLWLAIGDMFQFDVAQDISNNFLGGAIRLQVDVTETGGGAWTCPGGSHLPKRQLQTVTGNLDEMTGRFYCIPDDNPFQATTDELFEEFATLGNRNPHRIALDPVTGLLWSGEVGQDTREEINILIPGRNYQWPFMEGTAVGPHAAPGTIIGVQQPPVIDFDRSQANAIIGGYVYRGSSFPELEGLYITGDYVTNNIWAISVDMNSMTATANYLTNFDPGALSTFGQDNSGEVFMGSVASNAGLQRLERIGVPVPDAPALLSQTAAFDVVSTLDVHDAGVPYDLVPFWSDGAYKQRWLFLPNDGVHDTAAEQIGFAEQDDWTFPIGTVLMKHFELPTNEADPSIRVRLETRFIVFGDDGKHYGLTYRWRPDNSDADLLTSSQTQQFTIDLEGGGTRQQSWFYPSRNDCLQCHTQGSGGAAGLRTHQQNRDFLYPSTGRTDNQLRTWNHLGMFTPALSEAAIPTWLAGAQTDDAAASLELRARSWIDTNCSYCHRPETGNRAAFDARLTTPLIDQGLVWGGVNDSLGLTGAYLVHPGSPLLSVVNLRAVADGGSPIAMPPLGKELADPAALELLYEWILRADTDFPRPGLDYEYYEAFEFSELPDFDALTPVTTGWAANFDVSLAEREDNFAFRFTGYIEIPSSGSWTFYTASDDGSALFIDGTQVVFNDGLHSLQEQSGIVTLAAGYHAIQVTMFDAYETAQLQVLWEGPGVGKQAIPGSRLVTQIPVSLSNAAPDLTSPGNQQNAPQDVVSLTLTASDPDLDLLYFDSNDLPPGLSLDSGTGTISGTIDVASSGTYDVTLSASDGPEISVRQIVWTVPEPSLLLQLLPGCSGIVVFSRRRRRRTGSV